MTRDVGREALIPNPRLAAFHPLIGSWTTVGHHALLPGVTLHGRATVEWHEGGAFVCMRSEFDEPEIPSGIAIFGDDDQAEGLTMLYFDERRVSRRYEATMSRDGLRWWRNAPAFAQRYLLTVSPDGDTLHASGELAKDGGPWGPDLQVTYTRQK
jgi:hypothetical protein